MNTVAYTSVDELEHFRFDDCQINTFAVTENGVELMVEALIVRADNSQNTNYTETPEIFICSGGAWHDVPFELERMQPPVHELSGDSRNGSNRGQYRAGDCPR